MRGRNKARVKEKKIPPSICSLITESPSVSSYVFCAMAAEVLISVKLFESLF